MSKRFIIFYGDNYYPEGGWKDFSHDGGFETLTAAKERVLGSTRDWGHIVDLQSGTIVYEWTQSGN